MKGMITNENLLTFCVATHLIEVIIPSKINWERHLPSFIPFKYDSNEVKKPICSIRVVDSPILIEPGSAKLLNEVFGIVGHSFCLFETAQNYVTDIQFIEDGTHYRMVSDKIFSTATAYVDWNDKYVGIVLSSFLMIAFAQSAILHQTLLIHASVVEKDEKGYAFLGKSGMGKSTHSALWLRHIAGTALLNDDNPVVHIETDGTVYIYGTPWSGKKPCYKNRRVALQALVRLVQATHNRFTWKKGVDALITILPSCSSIRWNILLYNEMCNLLEEIITKVNVGNLECLPTKEAVLLCYEETGKMENEIDKIGKI